jgi:MoaA/NifB/PqqE/SkfB family radical SAM enzyme
MCGFGQEAFSKDKFMTFESFKKIVDEVGAKTEILRLNGRGESTIHPKFIKMLDYVKSKFPKIRINLFTNLSFKNDLIIKKFVEHDLQLFISMDSNKKTELEEIRKGANYELIINNLDKLKIAQTRPFIVFTIQEINIFSIYDIALFAQKNNCHILFNTVRRDSGMDTFKKLVSDNLLNIKTQFKKAEKLYANTGLLCLYPNQLSGIQIGLENATKTHGELISCPMIDKELCVLYNGDVTPCNMFNPFVYGNLNNNEFTEIWNGEKRKEFKQIHKSYYYCNNCANLGK